MFVQLIEGRVRDEDGLLRQLERWREELAAGATGWLGTTAGVADDGTFIAAARFESAEAAQANSERPEQGAWWEETAGNLEGEVSFKDCPQVDAFGAGGSDDAGFVQFIQGRADREQVAATGREVEDVLRRTRPDVIGGIFAWPGDGTFTQIVYFTSEAEARKGESAEMSPEDAEAMGQAMSLVQPERYVSLSNPILVSA